MKNTSFEYILRLGDTALIHGQRISEWCGHAPGLEEDIALSNIALDHIGQSRYLLTLAGQLENDRSGKVRNEDQLAYFRNENEFRNFTIVELSNNDFAHTILKIFLVSSFQLVLWKYLKDSKLASLSEIAEKAVKEAQYHQEFSADWTIKLGDGTEFSNNKMQIALDYLMPFASEFFLSDEIEDHSSLKEEFLDIATPVLLHANLKLPKETPFVSTGKKGIHTEELGKILAEMQTLQRSYPNGVW